MATLSLENRLPRNHNVYTEHYLKPQYIDIFLNL